jgi:acyl-CoA dehydrogenase
MDLELSEDQRALQAEVRRVLEEQCPPALPRALHERGETGDALWRQMAELHWPGVAIAEAQGGLGLGAVELCLVAEELGRAVAPGPFLATATQLAPLLQEAPESPLAGRLLQRIAEGRLTGSVAVAEGDRWELGAIACRARPMSGGQRLDGHKTAVFDGARADEIAVVARTEAGLGVFLVPGAAVKVQPRTTHDPTLGLVDLVLEGVAVQADRVLLSAGPAAERAVTRALEVATVALALATVGTCRHIFEQTLAYTKVRKQYDRPIGSFQALKHRAANMFVEVELSRSIVLDALRAIDENRPDVSQLASIAKARVSDAIHLVGNEAVQMFGGIGVTDEEEIGLFLKRARVAELTLGDAAYHRARFARLNGF